MQGLRRWTFLRNWLCVALVAVIALACTDTNQANTSPGSSSAPTAFAQSGVDQASVTRLEAQVDSLAWDLEALAADYESLLTQHETIVEDLHSAQARIEDLESDHALANRVAELEYAVASLETNDEQHENDLWWLEMDVDALSTDVCQVRKDLEDLVDELRGVWTVYPAQQPC